MNQETRFIIIEIFLFFDTGRRRWVYRQQKSPIKTNYYVWQKVIKFLTVYFYSMSVNRTNISKIETKQIK